ncbi:TIGR02391 family protein [Nocardia sp. NPDC052001]|uniref:TIGR02391 family protein n=1 Tax=Nocardia sp. NPDC052001 TaxID=3154853 RepID=UPI003443F9B0
MARRECYATAHLPHGHHQNWPLAEQIERELDRVTAQWPSAGPEIKAEGINELYGRYASLLDLRIVLAEDARDVTQLAITRFSKNDDDGSEWHLAVYLNKHRSETSWVYVSGPVQATCDALARNMQEYILKLIDYPTVTGGSVPSAMETRLQGLHPAIKAGAIARLRTGHGDDAVEEACKSIGARLRRLGNLADQDGAALVSETLGRKRLIALNSGATQTEVSEQEGYMYLGMALFRAGRNPRAHRPSDPEFDEDEVVEWLYIASALHRVLDRVDP